MPIPTARVITLRDTFGQPRWLATAQHLTERGVPFEPFFGINGARFGLLTALVYAEDNPGTGFKTGSKTIGMTLSHYMLWKVFTYQPHEGDVLWVNEDDARYVPDWRERLEAAMASLPVDWDMLYVGSCCTDGKVQEVLAPGLCRVAGPLCTHSYMVRRKAIDILLDTQQLAWAGIDIQLARKSHAHLKVYTCLPRIADQHDTILPP